MSRIGLRNGGQRRSSESETDERAICQSACNVREENESSVMQTSSLDIAEWKAPGIFQLNPLEKSQ